MFIWCCFIAFYNLLFSGNILIQGTTQEPQLTIFFLTLTAIPDIVGLSQTYTGIVGENSYPTNLHFTGHVQELKYLWGLFSNWCKMIRYDTVTWA